MNIFLLKERGKWKTESENEGVIVRQEYVERGRKRIEEERKNRGPGQADS
jgi:hypothetical protein